MTIKDVQPLSYNYINEKLHHIKMDACIVAGQTYERLVREVISVDDEQAIFILLCQSCGSDVQYNVRYPKHSSRGDVTKLVAGDGFPRDRGLNAYGNTILCVACHSLVEQMIDAGKVEWEGLHQTEVADAADLAFRVKNSRRHSPVSSGGGGSPTKDGPLPHGNGYKGHWHR